MLLGVYIERVIEWKTRYYKGGAFFFFKDLFREFVSGEGVGGGAEGERESLSRLLAQWRSLNHSWIKDFRSQ